MRIADRYKLRGELPSELRFLDTLQIFQVSRNEIGGTLPTEYGLLNKLETFKVGK